MQASEAGAPLFRRFDAFHRMLHGVLMFSFLGLALTGMPLRFADAGWARVLARAWRFYSAAFFTASSRRCSARRSRRTSSALHRLYVRKELDILWGPASMVRSARRRRDDQSMRWFLGLGPRPRYDHFT